MRNATILIGFATVSFVIGLTLIHYLMFGITSLSLSYGIAILLCFFLFFIFFKEAWSLDHKSRGIDKMSLFYRRKMK